MQIQSFSPAAIASSVWQNAARTLTTDPATDAGAATLVWTHAARTLTADPATDAGAATLVWTHAARSLTVDPATDAGAATLVWARATRQLTSLAANYTGIGTTNSLANGSVLDLRPAAGKFRHVSALWVNNPASTLMGFYDGTTFTGVAVTTGFGEMCGYNTYGPALKNSNGSSQSYAYAGFDIS